MEISKIDLSPLLLSERTEILENLSRDFGMYLVDELLSILQSPEFAFCSLPTMCKTRKDCGKLLQEHSDGDSMKALSTQAFINVENCEGTCKPFSHKKYIFETLQRQELIAGDKEGNSCT